jgi:hypothetical protein
MPVASNVQPTDETRKVSSLIEQLQNAHDGARELSNHHLRSWVMECIDAALKALREEY